MFTIVSQTPRFDLLAARQLSYLTKGLIKSPQFDEAYNNATEHFGYGEDSMLECLQIPAALLADIYDSNDNHPGVFEYEVTEKVGAFLAEYLAVPENTGSVPWDVVVEYAGMKAAEFFAKYQPPPRRGAYALVPSELYVDLLNYLESCAETERHNPGDPCHDLLSRLKTAGTLELVDVTLDDEEQARYIIQSKE